jgi:glycosyltransferase involved in cell wall biosynthesis
MTVVLVVHHDADLYGADQSLLRTVKAIRQQRLMTPVVVLPHSGPLVPLLEAAGIEVHIGPVVKLSRQVLRPSALPRLLAEMVQSIRFLSRVVAGRKVVLVYSNSVSVLGGGLWAAVKRLPRLWHVREIVVSPKLAASGFPWMLQTLGGWCVCNSAATRRWITSVRPALADRSSVLWNGLEPVSKPDPAEVLAFRSQMGFSADHLVITLVGRLNRWKGQGVLIQAARQLVGQGHSQLRFLIVGDVADGQHHFRESMLADIQAAGLQDVVKWHPFTPKVDLVWSASDVAVVPSIEPEPFGRVAIEAMAHGLPVVAANHGGLAEIVVQGETGLLVAPNDATALADALRELADAGPGRRHALGAAGAARQAEHFSQAAHDVSLLALMQQLAHDPNATPRMQSAP